MISIMTLKGNPAATEDYLKENMELEKYYNGTDIERTSYEKGIYFGGKSLGIDGKIVENEFKDILDGKDVLSKNLYERGRKNRRVGFDLTLSPDKTLSLLWARCDEPKRRQLEESFATSCEETIEYIEKHILHDCVRRGPGGILREAPKELTWALFQHGTSRANDPQLHMHCILMNQAKRQDGSYGAVEAKAMFEKQSEIRNVFDLSLAKNLKEHLGLKVIQHKEGIEVEGISRNLVEEFSKRRKEILERADKIGITTHQAKDLLVLQTRKDKNKDIKERDLIPEWQKKFDEHGFTKDILDTLFNKKLKISITPDDESGIHTSILNVIHSSHRSLSESDLRAICAKNYAGHCSLSDLDEKVEKLKLNKELLKIEVENRPVRYTTHESIKREKSALDCGKLLSERTEHPVDEDVIKKILSSYVEKGMSHEQKVAAEYICKSNDLTLLIGAAGTGKSYSLRATREILEASGYSVRGLAPTGKAAENLETSSGILSKTADKFLYDKEKNKDAFESNTVVIIDEAAMLGSEKMGKLLTEAYKNGSKIILVGDDKQLASLQPGRPFEVLKNQVGACEITEVRRQKIEWQKQAAQDMRDGKARNAFLKYEDNGLVCHKESWEEIKKQLTTDWCKDRSEYPEESQLILATTREKVREINQSIRTSLMESGDINKKKTTRINVSISDGHFESREFAPGDRIYFTRNNSELDVKNGTLGTIENIIREKRGVFTIEAKTDNGKRINFTTDKYNSLDHGYAATVHKSQGDTVNRTYLIAEKMMNQEAAYVSLSRHKDECRIYSSTELIHGHRREFENALESERRNKLHLEKLTKNIEIFNIEKTKAIAPNAISNEPTYVTTEHTKSANMLLSSDRGKITKSLYDLATLPRGVEHRYSHFEKSRTDYQIEASKILDDLDYSKPRLEKLKELVTSKNIGVRAVLTNPELQEHYSNVSESVKNYEKAKRCDKETLCLYLSSEQKIKLEKLAFERNPSEQVNILREITTHKGVAGSEFQKSKDIFHLNRLAFKNIVSFDSKATTAWAKDMLNREWNLGKEVPNTLSESTTEKVNTNVDLVKSKINLSIKEESKQEFTTDRHLNAVKRLLESKNSNGRIEALKEIVSAPRGNGLEFGVAEDTLTSWQFKAKEYADLKRVPHYKEILTLSEMIRNAPKGLPSTRADNSESQAFETLEKLEKSKSFSRSHDKDIDMDI